LGCLLKKKLHAVVKGVLKSFRALLKFFLFSQSMAFLSQRLHVIELLLNTLLCCPDGRGCIRNFRPVPAEIIEIQSQCPKLPRHLFCRSFRSIGLQGSNIEA